MTRKQEHDRARRRYLEREASLIAKQERRARTQRVIAVIATVAVVAGLIAGLAFAFLPDRGDTSRDTSGAAGCEDPPKTPGTRSELTLPDPATAQGKTWTATISTNCGDIVMELDGAKAPQAVASFIQLARADYWLNAPCHRLTDDSGFSLLQCGDPTGTGSGTPGYGYAVENAPADGTYPRGSVAMARTPDPKTGNGGQFFIMYDQTSLPDSNGYTVFAQVTSGLDIVDKIAAAGVLPESQSATDGPPAAPLSFLRVSVEEKKDRAS